MVQEYSFPRYLAAKKGLDDRSLNRHVWERLVQCVAARRDPAPLRVLEVGCGTGTMLERLLDWGLLTRAAYTGVDAQADLIREARTRLGGFAPERCASLENRDGCLLFRTSQRRVSIEFEAADLFDFLARKQSQSAWDLLVAHAFLDLVDLGATLPPLLSLAAPGGLFYFTLNFDGLTVLEPPVEPELDARIERLYHQTMDHRRVRGEPSGDSRTGRRLLGHLRAAGVRVLAAGSSDWVVCPGPEGYSGDEAYFLHFIIHTMHQALLGHPEMDEARLHAWAAARHGQIEAGEMTYIAHQLDVVGYAR